MAATVAPALAPDLEAALRRLKLAAVRRLAPELLMTAHTQRWAPDELMRTVLEAELAARDASNARARLRAAGLPVRKTLDEFAVAESSVPRATFDDLASLEWIRPKENLVLLGPAGTGKSHTLIALGHAAVEAGFRVRYFAAASLAEALDRDGGPARRHAAAGTAGRVAPRVTVEITEAGANHIAAWDIDQRVRAIHEAGDAVMAAALGMPVKAVDISGRHGGYRDPGLADDSLPDTTSEPRSPERFRRTAPMEALPPAPASPRAVWAIGMTVAAVRR